MSERNVERCKTCRWWVRSDRGYRSIENPVDPDTFQPMKMPFEVRTCTSQKILFCERPIESNGAALEDGSGYRATLYTAENFGCINHEKA